MKSGRVLCEVGTTVWYIMSINVSTLSGSAMLHVIGSRSFTMENRVRSRVSQPGIRGGLSDTLTGFSPSTSVLHCQYHSTNARYWSLSTCCFYHKNKHAKSGNLKKTNCPLAQFFSVKRSQTDHATSVRCVTNIVPTYPHKVVQLFLLFLRIYNGRVALNPHYPTFFLTKRNKTRDVDLLSVPAPISSFNRKISQEF